MRCCCFRYDYESLSKTCLRCRCVCVCEWGWVSVSVRAMPVCVSTMPWCGCEYDGRYEKGRSAFSLVEAAAKWANMSVMNYVFALYINKPSLAHTHTLSHALCLAWWLFLTGAQGGSPHPILSQSNPSPPFQHPFLIFFYLPSFFRLLIRIIFPTPPVFCILLALSSDFARSPKFMTVPVPPPLSHPPTWKQRRRRKQHY